MWKNRNRNKKNKTRPNGKPRHGMAVTGKGAFLNIACAVKRAEKNKGGGK